MTSEWEEITDPEELFRLKKEGWEIEYRHMKTEYWRPWVSTWWQADTYFHARPTQPKMKKIKMMCWLDEYNCLCWTSSTARSTWVRIPQQDIEIEVPE